jgi:hypothetical protein
MFAIHTKYLSLTKTRGPRIKAYTSGSTYMKGFAVTIAYPNQTLERVSAHFKAVMALVEKHDLQVDTDNMRYGDSADGKGFSFCFDHSKVTT